MLSHSVASGLPSLVLTFSNSFCDLLIFFFLWAVLKPVAEGQTC